MRKLSKTLLSLLLIAAMLASFVVLPAAAEEPAAEQPTEAVQAAETQSKDAVEGFDLSIVMLDCGRKYFSVDSIKQIIDNAAAAGFNNVMLAVGNDWYALPAGRYEPDRERHDLFQRGGRCGAPYGQRGLL